MVFSTCCPYVVLHYGLTAELQGDRAPKGVLGPCGWHRLQLKYCSACHRSSSHCSATPAWLESTRAVPVGLAWIAAMGKETLSDGDGLKAQVSALTRDYVVEPHIGPLPLAARTPVIAVEMHERATEVPARSPVTLSPDPRDMLLRVPDSRRSQRSSRRGGACQGVSRCQVEHARPCICPGSPCHANACTPKS